VRERLAVTPHARIGARSAVGSPADTVGWVGKYLRSVVILDACAALAAGFVALQARYHHYLHPPVAYLVLTLSLPAAWIASVALARGYEGRIMGVGADEFRRVFNAGLSLTAVIAIVSYATKANLSRGYLLVAMPCVVGLDLCARYALRKRLHRWRTVGAYMRRAVAVGHPADVANLATELRREPYHGLVVVGACLASYDQFTPDEVAGIPVFGGLEDVTAAVQSADADTVAVLACQGLNGSRLRQLAWDLEKTRTELCLAPALLDVAGPRTTVRAAAGLPLLYVQHPDLAGVRQVVKSLFDRLAAASALIALSPLLLWVAIRIRREDGGPILFRQVRVGKNGHTFRVFKFRTMVPDAEKQKAALASLNEVDGVLFKIRNDPRVTRPGVWLRKYSIDEIPQLFNVLRGEMSLVGPRPWAPMPYQEAARSGNHVWRRVAVKPGLTGLWQVSGRADLPWEESVRLDLRYVENWSFALDIQILWKTARAVVRGSGAY
jgi:exopolysaccharide biosynthesis polyprenyl glycosylphosphotransferase